MSDYLAQVVRQRDAALERAKRAEQLLAAAEDELQKWRGRAGKRQSCPPACTGGRHMYDGGCLIDPQYEPDVISGDGRGPGQWAWRCWGTDSCDGLLSLDHSSPAAARRAYDRHCLREHAELPEDETAS
jgi:hypothetical protein